MHSRRIILPLSLMLLLFVGFVAPEKYSVIAEYIGHKENVYHFEDSDGEQYLFENLSSTIIKKFNLNEAEHIGSEFDLTYEVIVSEEEEEYENETYKLMKLKLH